MGVDFVALMKYTTGLTDEVLAVIDRLEQGELFPELVAITQYAEEQGFLALTQFNRVEWVNLKSREPIARPKLFDLNAALRLKQSFYLTFSYDTIRAYNLLRWHTFLTDETCQRLMLSAMRLFCNLFCASDCVIMGDDHPANLSFFDGHSFNSLLRHNGREYGRKATIADLYYEVDYDGELAMKPSGQIVLHSRSKPLPKGWKRPTV